MGGWRSEAVDAVRELLRLHGAPSAKSSWKVVGRARPSGRQDWLVIDLRDSIIRPDNLDQLCLSDEQGPDHSPTHPVVEYRFEDGLLHLRRPAGTTADDSTAWMVSLSTRVLIERLLEGLQQAGDTPLADALAANRFAGALKRTGVEPPGLFPAQLDAYRACLSSGLRLVWGPPGAGKTRVLARAIEELVRRGKRVLLVSTANVAVDNALRSVIRTMRPPRGAVVRVGPAHLAEIAQNRDVQIDELTAAAARRVNEQRLSVEADLERLARIEAEIADQVAALSGYDHAVYLRAVARVDNHRRAASLRHDLDIAVARREMCATERGAAKAEVDVVEAEWDRIARERALFAEVAEYAGRLAELDQTIATQDAAYAAAAAHTARLQRTRGGPIGWFGRRHRIRRAAGARDAKLHELQLLVREHHVVTAAIERCREAAHPVTEQDVFVLAARRDAARSALRQASAVDQKATMTAARLRRSIAEVEHAGIATDAELEFVTACDRDGKPAAHERLGRQRAELRRYDRGKLNARRRELLDEARRLRRDAEGEVIRNAKVVATTLARSRAHRVLAGEQFDVVLVDEAGAAMLAEVLLVLCRADTTAVLFGDFLQLGPVIEQKVRDSRHPAVRRWVLSDCFTHSEIRTPQEAQRHPSCVVLQHQFRFGPNLRELANRVIYEVLRDADEVPGVRANPHTDIVVVDVGDLPGLAEVRTNQGRRGWWSAGVVLSRALAEYHLGEDEGDGAAVGIVTPYTAQRDCTLAALRDKDIVRNVTVGTVHAFQGREFPTVILDLVEDGRGWVAKADLAGNSYAREGLRLFGVGITRARNRLYVIAKREAILAAARGPLAELRTLCERGGAETWSAAALLGLDEHRPGPSGSFAEVAELLRQLVSITDISDEHTFWTELRKHLSGASGRVWMWSPWIANRADQVIPLIADAIGRGVDVRVMIRPDDDRLVGNEWAQRRLSRLLDTGATVVRVDHEHRKIIVVDDRTVLMGSLNTLSQSSRRGTREIMITMEGRVFAERLLKDLHAEELGTPRHCDRCRRQQEVHRENARSARWLLVCPNCGRKQILTVGSRTGIPATTAGPERTRATPTGR